MTRADLPWLALGAGVGLAFDRWLWRWVTRPYRT